MQFTMYRMLFSSYILLSVISTISTIVTIRGQYRTNQYVSKEVRVSTHTESFVDKIRRPISVAEMANVKFMGYEGWRPVAESPTKATPCQPKHRIVFVKTHKTGSSTIAVILERYGYRKNLNFALPRKPHGFSHLVKFNASSVYQRDLEDSNGTVVWPALGGFHILANHARYNRAEQNAIIPNAVYFTIIREPASQFESAFDFFKLSHYMPNHALTDVFKTDLKMYLNLTKEKNKVLAFIRNGQMYDLGLEQETQDPKSVDAKITSLTEEMDLVMITEYFDESLILLKRLLCWEFDDIVYVSQLVRTSGARKNVTADQRDNIYKWNHADVKLYQHFNKTFWERVQSYGPAFQRDLETFRELKAAIVEKCLANATVRLGRSKARSFRLPQYATQKCKDLVKLDRQWVTVIKRHMTTKSDTFMKIQTNDKGNLGVANK